MPKPRYGQVTYYIRDADEHIREYHIFASLKAREAFIEHNMQVRNDDKHFIGCTRLTPKQFEIATSPGWTNRPPPVIVDHRKKEANQ